MSNILFYDDASGAGAVGRLEGHSFRTTQEFGAGSFSAGWTRIAEKTGFLLFYNKESGAAATGRLDRGTFVARESFPAGFFSPDWTHVTGRSHLTLFYRASTGEGAIVTGNPFQTIKSFPADGFARGWTDIVVSPTNPSLLFFYNAENGAGAIAEEFDNRRPGSGGFAGPNDIRTLVGFDAGSFTTGWTHIVGTPDGKLLFYNKHDGSGALGTMNREGFQTIRSFSQGDFAPGWTHIVSAGESLLFYNADDGSGAIGFDPTVQAFPVGSFGRWTHLASQGDAAVVG